MYKNSQSCFLISELCIVFHTFVSLESIFPCSLRYDPFPGHFYEMLSTYFPYFFRSEMDLFSAIVLLFVSYLLYTCI